MGKKWESLLLVVALSMSLLILPGLFGCQAEEPSDTTPAATTTPTTTAPSSDEVYTLVYVHSLPASDFTVPLMKESLDRITVESGGRLQFQFLTEGEHPYSGSDMLNIISKGLADMGETEDVYISGTDPALCPLALPFIGGTYDVSRAALEQMRGEIFEPLLNEKYGVSIVSDFLTPGEAVYATRFLDSFDALKGTKIRVWNKETADFITAIGGDPITVSFSELYSSLQLGVVDGALTGISAACDEGLYEVVKYTTWWDWCFPWDFTVINQDSLDSLPPDLQEILIRGMKEAGEYQQERYLAATSDYVVKGMVKYGVKFAAISPQFRSDIQARMSTIYSDWEARAGANGTRALEIFESLQ